MFWADRVAKEIIDSNNYQPYWVDDMKTLSGFPTVGSLKGPLVHELIFRALKHFEAEVAFTYIFNDFDPIDGLSDDLKVGFEKYMGFPLKTVPSPVEGFDNFADYFGDDFSKVLEKLGVKPKYLSSWDMYHEGKFDEVIKMALDNGEKIQDIYQKISGSQKKEQGWLPFQVICENCGKLGTTRVYGWDGEKVSYKCEPNMVKWATGCDFEGKVSPFGGTGKLPWKVDWPAHWKVLGVTIEGAGKDHASAGGSRDIAVEICKEVFDYQPPFNLPYEFILIGGKKMSTSKGLGFKAREITDLLPSELARFLFARTDYRQQVNFDPLETMAIPDLFDEYDRCFMSYINDDNEDLSRAFEMSQINDVSPKEKTFLPRFIDVVNYLQQPTVDIIEKFTELKGGELSGLEKKILDERIKYSKVWLEKYAPERYRFQMTGEIPNGAVDLSNEQKTYLKKVVELLAQNLSSEDLQTKLYELSKEIELEPKKAFAAIYLSIIGKESGPKAGWLLNQYPSDKIRERLEEVIG